MQGGRVHLEVNVDGLGPAEKTGVLKVEKFRILGDQVLNEVVGSADTSRPAIDPKRGARRVQREYFDFDLMRVPFSVGHGQFAMEDSYLRGPLVGLTLRGKADYNAKSVNLSGTYIPLQGLNNVLVDVPLLSQLLSGPRAEGILRDHIRDPRADGAAAGHRQSVGHADAGHLPGLHGVGEPGHDRASGRGGQARGTSREARARLEHNNRGCYRAGR